MACVPCAHRQCNRANSGVVENCCVGLYVFSTAVQDPFTKTSTSTLGRTGSAVVDEKKTHIPGYTGFIRNSKVRKAAIHTAYSAAAGYSRPSCGAFAYLYGAGSCRSFVLTCCGACIEQEPGSAGGWRHDSIVSPTYQQGSHFQVCVLPAGCHLLCFLNVNTMYDHSDDTSSTLVGQYQSKVRHVPGYTGHVPELKHSVGKTYGSATEDLVERPINAKSDRKTLNKVSILRDACCSDSTDAFHAVLLCCCCCVCHCRLQLICMLHVLSHKGRH